MKSFSCISLSRPLSETSNPDHPIEIDSYKDDSTHVVRGHKGSCVHTLIEVLRCELGKHRRPSPSLGSTGLEPLKSWTPIYYAVYHNREAALLHFLRAEGSPDDVTGIGQPPLCIAVAAGHIGIVTILCEAGADVKATTKDNGETALHLAIKNGRTDIVEVLLSYGSDIEARTVHTGETPLHYAAAKTGSLAVVVALTRCGANYEALDSKGRSPAEVALQASNLHAAVAIISAAHGKRRKLVKEKELLLKHVEKAQNRFSMNNELISDIFEAGCDPDSTVLVEAIKRDDVALVEMFLDKGADPNRSTATGLHPIFAAMNCSKAQVVHTLVKHGADVTVRDAEGHTVLQAALESHSAHDKEAISGIFEALLSNGAEAKARFEDGQTLLHHVVSPGFGLAKVAQRLLEHGLKVDVRDKSGSTALHLAVQSRPCIEVLLKNGADVKAVDHRDLTPLLSALTVASKDNEPDLEPLIKVSDLRVVDSDKRTALHLAAQNGLEKSVKILLRCRAETTPLDSKNRTPLLLAVLSHQWSVVPLLVTQPGINCWDEAGATALHHIAMSIPQAPATWQDVALAAAKFCERGVSRSMRDRSGATPLIQAVKCLPEGGLPVLELLLTEKSPETRNCVNHEDHKKRSALYYAATMGKPLFVKALLMRGASYRVKEWTVGKGPLRPNTAVDKQTLKHMAEHEWLRRAAVLQRQSMSATTESLMPKVLPVQDLSELLAMGLDPNALPKSKYSSPLLWIILNQTQIPPAPPPQYIHDVLKLVLASGADANATTTRHINNASHKPSPMSLQPLSFLLEQHPTTDIDLITLFLDHAASLTTPSSFYNRRSPLHSAVRANRLDLVDEFLTRHADANPTDAYGRTPLFLAADLGFWEIADELLRGGAKLDVKDAQGNTPLHCAAHGGSKRIVVSLLRAGAKAAVTNAKGATPLVCVPTTTNGETETENKDENEIDKIVALLKHADAQEQELSAAADERQKQLERSAAAEGKARLQHERSQQQRLNAPLTSPKPKLSSRPSLSPSPSPSLPSQRSTTRPPANTSAVRSVSKQTLSQTHTPTLTPTTSALSLFPNASPSPSPQQQQQQHLSKPIPQPRVDSGFGHARRAPSPAAAPPPAETQKPLPALDRSKSALGAGESESKHSSRGSGDELAGWLAMSRMIERL